MSDAQDETTSQDDTPQDDTGVSLDPEGVAGPGDPAADREADDAGAVLPGAGDDQGLDDLSVDDMDEP